MDMEGLDEVGWIVEHLLMVMPESPTFPGIMIRVSTGWRRSSGITPLQKRKGKKSSTSVGHAESHRRLAGVKPAQKVMMRV